MTKRHIADPETRLAARARETMRLPNTTQGRLRAAARDDARVLAATRMTTPTLTADQIQDLGHIAENDVMGSRLRQSALDDGGKSLIALGLAEARHGRIRLTLDGLDALDELRRA